MNKTAWVGIVTIVFGLIVLIGSIAECPAKAASGSVSIFMVLVGVGLLCLGRDIERIEAKIREEE